MKRPPLDTLYSPVIGQTTAVAEKILDIFENKYQGYIDMAYAKVGYNDKHSAYEFYEETLNLEDKDDLLNRIKQDTNAMWCSEIDMEFAPSETYTTVYEDKQFESMTNVVISTEEEVTRFIEEESVVRAPYIMVLIGIAEAIGADFFLCGHAQGRWNPLPMNRFVDKNLWLASTYIVGWKNNEIDEQVLLKQLGNHSEEDIRRTTSGYKYVSLI